MYVPKAEAPASSWGQKDALPERPKETAPIFDHEHLQIPLHAFNDAAHKVNYASDAASKQPPPLPTDFTNAYLFPTLTRNERLRLTMLWYYTAGIEEDEDLLRRLQDKVQLVKEMIGWDFVIVGVMDINVYTRLATANLPLAILPRRESTCAHTINQPAGSVFTLPNMARDWRFQHSPHVEIGGLRSYTGTQLRVKTEQGDEVALGSLCVASNTERNALSPSKQKALVQFADMLTAEIVNASREKRSRQREWMRQLVAKVQSQTDADNADELVLEAVRQVYPGTRVEIQVSEDNKIRLDGRAAIEFTDLHDGLWEDEDFLNYAMENRNYQNFVSTTPIRAIVGKCSKRPGTQYLVVASNDCRHVFDDVDSWFIDRCAFMLCHIWQEHTLKEALKAKETFLRGVTHQLRTPIHGILGSVDLLMEELRSRKLLSETSVTDGFSQPSSAHNILSFLNTIQRSGRELMSTVNNMLKLNRWAEVSNTHRRVVTCDLVQFESELLSDISVLVPEEDFEDTAIFFHNRLPPECRLLMTDAALLKDCIQALLVNAVQSTAEGSVAVTISTTADRSVLDFDVVDTGRGIRPEDYERIFLAYEKEDSHTRGVGLGLTLASRIASFLNGSVVLVSSTVGKGSHFRASFRNPAFSTITNSTLTVFKPENLPLSFHVKPYGGVTGYLTEQFALCLEQHGLHESDTVDNALILLGLFPKLEQLHGFTASMRPGQVAICVMPAGQNIIPAIDIARYPGIIFASGPFTSLRLEEILQQADALYKAAPSSAQTTDDINMLVSKAGALAVDNIPPLPITPSIPTSPRISLSNSAVLLVDDNAINLRILQMYCVKRHVPYASAINGREAVSLFTTALQEGKPYGLVLMDLQMPVLDGAQACEEIRQLERGSGRSSKDIATIFIITGQDSESEKTRSVEAGADQFLVKPVSIATLDKTIGAYMNDFLPAK